MKKIYVAILLLITVSAMAQTNRLPITKPDTITILKGKSGTFNVLKNDLDPENDSIHVTSIRNNTTPYSINKLIALPTCKIHIDRFGNFTVTPADTFTGTINTISYIANDGKHSSGVSGKIVINVVAPAPVKRDTLIYCNTVRFWKDPFFDFVWVESGNIRSPEEFYFKWTGECRAFDLGCGSIMYVVACNDPNKSWFTISKEMFISLTTK